MIEVCVESLEEAVEAELRDADQIELCSNLALDGLTPSISLATAVLKAVSIPVKIMIRPRAGDFFFSDDDLRQMEIEITTFKALGFKHFVIGMITASNHLNTAAIRSLCAYFPRCRFTLHKVIDTVLNPLDAIRDMNSIPNLYSILTSGGAPTAIEGAKQILTFQSVLSSEKKIIAAGKITAENLSQIRTLIPVPIYHGRRILGEL